MARIIFHMNFFHLTSLMSSHYLVKHKSANFYITLKQQLINGRTEIHFIEPGVKVNGAYYRDNLLAKKLLPDIYQKIPKLGFVFQQDGVLAHRARDIVPFLERKVLADDFVSPTLWSPNSPDLIPEGYSIRSAGLMQEKVYRSRIANVNELEMIDEWGRFDQSIVYAAIAASGAVVLVIVSVERDTV